MKRWLRRAEHLRNAGEYDRSEILFARIFSAMSDHGDKTHAAYYYPRACHQLALTRAAQGQVEDAIRLVIMAIKSFDQDNHLGRGRAARTHGWLLYRQGEVSRALREFDKARTQLNLDQQHSNTKRQREMLITDGLRAFCDPEFSRQDKLATMQRVDAFLRDGPKWGEELSNLERMIPMLTAVDRPFYMVRAAQLRRRIMIREDLRVLVDDITNREPAAAIRFGWRLARHAFIL